MGKCNDVLRKYNFVSRPIWGLRINWAEKRRQGIGELLAKYPYVRIGLKDNEATIEIGTHRDNLFAGLKNNHPGLLAISRALRRTGLLSEDKPCRLSFARMTPAEIRNALRELVRLSSTANLKKVDEIEELRKEMCSEMLCRFGVKLTHERDIKPFDKEETLKIAELLAKVKAVMSGGQPPGIRIQEIRKAKSAGKTSPNITSGSLNNEGLINVFYDSYAQFPDQKEHVRDIVAHELFHYLINELYLPNGEKFISDEDLAFLAERFGFVLINPDGKTFSSQTEIICELMRKGLRRLELQLDMVAGKYGLDMKDLDYCWGRRQGYRVVVTEMPEGFRLPSGLEFDGSAPPWTKSPQEMLAVAGGYYLVDSILARYYGKSGTPHRYGDEKGLPMSEIVAYIERRMTFSYDGRSFRFAFPNRVLANPFTHSDKNWREAHPYLILEDTAAS